MSSNLIAFTRLCYCKLPLLANIAFRLFLEDQEENKSCCDKLFLFFQTDYGCDIEKGSVCTYHPGCVHCVRAIQGR